MKVFISVVLVTALTSAFGKQLLPADDLLNLFRLYARNALTDEQNQMFQDALDILHRHEYGLATSFDDLSPTRMSIDCLICRGAFATVYEGVATGQSDAEISRTVALLCTNLGIENYNVCEGAVSLNIPIITHIIRTTPAATPNTFCGLVLQNSGNPNFCPVDDSRFEWTVTLPPAAPPRERPVIHTKPLKIALIADAHIDPLYEAYGAAECGEPTCCRVGQTVSHHFKYKSFIDESLLSRSIVNSSGQLMLDLSVAPEIRKKRSSSRTRFLTASNPRPAGYWGDYRNCDTPIWAFDDVIDRIAETNKDVDLVYYVGDTIDHFVWETTYDLINEVNRYLIKKMKSTFGDNVLVIPTIGNHESQPTNQFAPSSVTEPYLNTTWLYNGLANKWQHYLTEDATATLKNRGDFSRVVSPGLRVISLNTNVAYTGNWWLAYDPLDAKKHLDWLISELSNAEQVAEKVHIVTHIPPGSGSLTHTWTREYNRIINRFTDTIAAEFNGHTHADQFKIYYNPEGRPINVAWGVGSATSYTYYNLNYKIVEVNPATYAPESMSTYIYNLTEANLTPHRRPHWFQLYDMKNTYVLSDLSPASMDNLVNRMVTTDRHLLDIYAAFSYKLSDSRWPYCGNNCQLGQVCNAVTTVLWDRRKCDELSRLFTRANNS